MFRKYLTALAIACASVATPALTQGQIEVRNTQDSMTDEITTVIDVPAVINGTCERSETRMLLRCKDDQLAVMVFHGCVATGTPVPGETYSAIAPLIRFDREAAFQQSFVTFPSGDGFMMSEPWDTEPVAAFIEGARQASILRIRFSDALNVERTMVMALNGLDAAINQAESSCEWPGQNGD